MEQQEQTARGRGMNREGRGGGEKERFIFSKSREKSFCEILSDKPFFLPLTVTSVAQIKVLRSTPDRP